MLEAIAGIYGPLLGLVAFAILWPIRLIGLGLYYLGGGIVWCVDRAHDYFERWVTF